MRHVLFDGDPRAGASSLTPATGIVTIASAAIVTVMICRGRIDVVAAARARNLLGRSAEENNEVYLDKPIMVHNVYFTLLLYAAAGSIGGLLPAERLLRSRPPHHRGAGGRVFEVDSGLRPRRAFTSAAWRKSSDRPLTTEPGIRVPRGRLPASALIRPIAARLGLRLGQVSRTCLPIKRLSIASGRGASLAKTSPRTGPEWSV